MTIPSGYWTYGKLSIYRCSMIFFLSKMTITAVSRSPKTQTQCLQGFEEDDSEEVKVRSQRWNMGSGCEYMGHFLSHGRYQSSSSRHGCPWLSLAAWNSHGDDWGSPILRIHMRMANLRASRYRPETIQIDSSIFNPLWISVQISCLTQFWPIYPRSSWS